MPAPPRLAGPLTDGVVLLRHWQLDDAPGMRQVFLDDEIFRWTDALPDESLDDFTASIRRGWARGERGERECLAITAVADGEIVGVIDLMYAEFERAEIGYALGQWARGQGYATRAVELLTAWAFEVGGVERVELPIPVGNTRSRAVAERAEYTFEGVLRSYIVLRDGGERHDVTMFARVRADHT